MNENENIKEITEDRPMSKEEEDAIFNQPVDSIKKVEEEEVKKQLEESLNPILSEEEEEEYNKQFIENTKAFNSDLPDFIRRFQQDAIKVSFKNDIPAALSCFVILGQMVKDFVQIPNGRNIEDSRVHFCQIQTSGSGKSTMWDFTGKVTKKLFTKINDTGTHPLNDKLPDEDGYCSPKKFDVMGVTEYTDAALVGGYEETMMDVPVVDNQNQPVLDDNGYQKTKKEMGWIREEGLLEGSGLAHWDEFEYSGIFKQSQNKEQAIVYLNTLMNTLAGESWVISKKLKRGKIMDCYCERSILAMTYPPEKLVKVVANKGVLQRMILYIWDVPENTLDEMRRMQIGKAGTLEEINQPIDEFADEFFEIYQCVKARYEEVGKDPLKTMVFTENFREMLLFEYETMQDFIQDTHPAVRKIASNFTTRLLKILIKMAVLCSISEARNIEDPTKRFIVRGKNVRQAGNVVRKCYNTLVFWLMKSLRVKETKRTIGNKTQSPNEKLFYEAITNSKKIEIKGTGGWFSKAAVVKSLSQGETAPMASKTAERLFKAYKNEGLLVQDKLGRSVYLKLKEVKK